MARPPDFEFASEARRKFLLVMATGTGKLRTAHALIDGLVSAVGVESVVPG